jgi:hypothetical protein
MEIKKPAALPHMKKSRKGRPYIYMGFLTELYKHEGWVVNAGREAASQ